MHMFQIQKQFSVTLQSFKKQVQFWTGRKHTEDTSKLKRN